MLKGTIRKLYAASIGENAVHGRVTVMKNAAIESAFHFLEEKCSFIFF
jgi:nucleoside-diphosphate kinase